LRWDGAEWLESASGTNKDLRALWGSSSGDLWAGGAEGTLLHFTGKTWTVVPTGTAEPIVGLWGRAGVEIIAVTSGGSILQVRLAQPTLVSSTSAR
jgi:hypothetical protein